MGYYNPILNYGEQNIVRDAGAAGADGFIVVDLPPEEVILRGVIVCFAKLLLLERL